MKKTFLDTYEQNVDGIFSHFYKETADKETAKQLTQQVFIRTWDAIRNGKRISLVDNKWDNQQSPKEFMNGSFRNSSMRHRRLGFNS